MPATDQRPPQHQGRQPGRQTAMEPQPESNRYQGSGKLLGKVALVTGGDSGIGRAVAIAYAKEGANVAIVYLEENQDAEETLRIIHAETDQSAIAIRGDVGDESFCQTAVDQVIEEFGELHILVNNAAEQHPSNTLKEITATQLEQTFRTNIFSHFYMAKAALEFLQDGACIINTTSVTAYRGSAGLIDYSASKGAIVSFTRSLALNLIDQGIRVNGVAPGPIWTPLIPATFNEDEVAKFGQKAPMGRAGQPDEVSPSYVFLASSDSSYMSGQILHPNGGEIINT